MSINSVSMKRAMNECFSNLKEYFNLVLKLNKTVLKYLKSSSDNEELFLKIKDYEKRSNDLYTELYDAITWNISKEKPVSNNLRFFLASLSSLKDLERIADAGYNVSKFYQLCQSKKPKAFGVCIKLQEEMLSTMTIIWGKFLEKSGRLTKTSFNEFKKIHKTFHKFYIQVINDLAKEHLQNLVSRLGECEEESDENLVVFLSLTSKNIERCVDHLINIMENFFLIDSVSQENQQIERELKETK